MKDPYLLEMDDKKKAEQRKKTETIYKNITKKQVTRSYNNQDIPVKVDGIRYESLAKAAYVIGVGQESVAHKYRKLRQSKRKSMEFEFVIRKTFTLEKCEEN